MKVKSYRTKLLVTILPIMAIVFCAISMIMSTRADGVFTPPEIVESISYMTEKPTAGTPTDYTPLENFGFCNWQIYNASYFESDATGAAKADLGFTKYSQAVRNSRKIKNKTVFTETVSSSAFVSNAEQTYITPNNTVLFRPSAKVHGESVVWSDKITPMNTDTYFSKYGSVPREITKYVVTEETVLSARLLSFGGGEYIYEFVLDPELAGKYFRYEIATRAGSSQPARIISVKMTLTMDENWYVKSSVIEDEYATDVPALGSLTCRSEMTEVFRYIGEDRELEESKLFEPFLPKEGEEIPDGPIEQVKQPSDYLANAFAPYLDGEPLNLDVNLGAYGSTHNVKLGLDIATLDVDALVDDALYVGYGNERLYIGAGGLKGYIPTSSFKGLLDVIGEVTELPDMNIDLKEQLSEDFLGALFGGLELVEHDGYVSIDFGMKLSDVLVEGSPLLTIAGKLSGDISISVYDGETITLRGIDATLDIAGVPVTVNIVPISRPAFPDRGEFKDISGALDFVKPIINTVKAPAYKLGLNLDVKSAAFTDKIKIDAVLNRDLTLSADITLEKLGVTLGAVYDGKTVYLSSGNLRLKLDVDDFGEVLNGLTEILKSFGIRLELPDIELPEMSFDLDELLPKLLALDFKELLSHLEDFSLVGENELRAALNIGGSVYGANIAHDGEYLKSLKLDDISIEGVTLGIGATLECLDAPAPVGAQGEYVDATELLNFVAPVLPLISERSFAADVNLSALGLDIDGDIKLVINSDNSLALKGNIKVKELDIPFTFVNSRIYAECGNIKISLKVSDISSLVGQVTELMSSLGIKLDTGDIEGLDTIISSLGGIKDAIASLKSMSIGDILSSLITELKLENNTLHAGVKLGETAVRLSLTTAPVKVDIALDLDGNGNSDVTASLLLTDDTVTSIAAPEGDYIDIKELLDFVSPVLSLMNERSFAADIELSALGLDIDGDVKLVINADKSIDLCGNIELAGLNLSFVYVENRIYIESGNLKLTLQISDISELVGSIKELMSSLGIKLEASDINGLDTIISSVGGIKDAVASLKSMSINDILSSLITELGLENNTLYAGVKLGETAMRLSLTTAPVEADIALDLDGDKTIDVTASLLLTDDTVTSIAAPEGEYGDIRDLTLLVKALGNTISHNSYALKLNLGIGNFKADVALEFDRDFSVIKATVYIPEYELTLNALYANNTLYISALGIDVSVVSSDVAPLKEALLPLLPADVAGTAGTVFDLLAPLLDGDIKGAIGAALPDGSIKNILTSLIDGDISGIIGSLAGDMTKVDLSGMTDKFTLSLDSSSLAVSAGGFDIALTHDGDTLKTLSVGGKAGGKAIDVSVTLTSASENAVEYTVPENPVSASELARFVMPIKELTEKSGFVVKFEASLTMDNASLPISGEIVLLFKESGLELQINANVSGVEIFFAMKDGVYYISYDEMRVSATSADLDRLVSYVKPYLPAFAPRLIEEIKNGITNAMPTLGVKEILSAINGGGIDDDGALWLDVCIGDIAMTVSLSLTDDGKIDRLSLTGSTTEENIGEITISVGATIPEMYDDAEDKVLPFTTAGFKFVTADELIDYVDALINSFKLEAYHVSFDNIDVYYADKTERVTGYVEFQPTNGIPNLRMGINVYSKALVEGGEKRITDEELSTTLKHTFDIMITDGDPLQEIYLTYNGVRFKLTIEEVRYLLGNIKDMLDITDFEEGKEYDEDRISLLDKVIPADREKVSGDFLDDFNVTAVTKLADTASGLLTIVTDIINEGRDFMEDPDYDYTEIVGLAKKTIGTLASLLGLDNLKLPTLGGVINSMKSLPRISLEEGVSAVESTEDESEAAAPVERTMTVIIDGVKFTLTRDIKRNFLSNWTFTGLKTSSTSTDFGLTLTEADPEEVAEHVARPAYHDYDYGASLNNTYKHAEMRKDAESGLIDGYEPFGGKDFTENDVDADKRYKYSWFKYSQSNSGNYVKVDSDYVKIADFVSGAQNGSYMKINGEYQAFSSVYEKWFVAKYGMSSQEYINTLGSPLNDLSNISNFTTALINTANRKDFHISGKAHVSVLNIINVDIPLDIWVKLIPTKQADGIVVNKPLVIINISTPYVWSLLDRSATQIYYWNNMLYFAKTDTDGQSYAKVSWSDFTTQMSDMNNLQKYLFYVLPFKGLARTGLESAFGDSGSGDSAPLEFSEVYNYYYYENGSHIINIDLGVLAGTSMLSDAKIVLGTTKFAPSETEEAHTYVTSLAFDTSILGSVMPASLNASLDIVNTVTNYRTVSRITNDVLDYDSSHLILDETIAGAILPTQLALYRDYLASFEGTIV